MWYHRHLLSFFLLVFLGSTGSLCAQERDGSSEGLEKVSDKAIGGRDHRVSEPEGNSSSQRIPSGVYESIRGRRGNIDLWVTNYGVTGGNPAIGNAGVRWPRDGRPYIYGSGFWFGAQKPVEGELRKLCVLSYNPSSQRSWFVPGRIEGPYRESTVERTVEGINLYRAYSSVDYDSLTGITIDRNDSLNGGPNWPIWDTRSRFVPGEDHYFGDYIPLPEDRSSTVWPEGHVVISDEDLFAIYKDTDLDRYELGRDSAESEGYPIGIEVRQQTFTWEYGVMKDLCIMRYELVNKSDDTLIDSYFAPVCDIDIGQPSNDRIGMAIHDEQNDSLGLAVAWSETTGGDFGLGYIGFDLLQTPAVYAAPSDEAGFLRNDKLFYTEKEQVGLHTGVNWVLDFDPQTSQERYDFISQGTRITDNGAGEKKIALSTGPFTMRPGDTAVIALAWIFAKSASDAPNGEWGDTKFVVDLDVIAQEFWDTFSRTNSVEQAEEHVRRLYLDLR